MFKEDNFEKRISIKFLLNRHLPKRRKTLKELLLEDKPSINNLDGSTHYFDRKELEKIASMIPEWEHDKLRPPIYLEMSSSMERGAIKITGRIECRMINRILHEVEKTEKIEEHDSQIILSSPEKNTKRASNDNTVYVHDVIAGWEGFEPTTVGLCE